jgi:lytic cellulose monooxygenase (C1-hydroxylating)
MNACCGKVDVKIPTDIAPGDYLLRAEVIALHTAGSSGGAQLYMTCYQLQVSGNGTAAPATVKFPGAYKASDPGLMFNIHAKVQTYVIPGPSVVAGGTVKTAGTGCSGGCQATCSAGKGPTGTALLAEATAGAAGAAGGASAAAACSAKYAQCGGQGWTGCSVCPVS